MALEKKKNGIWFKEELYPDYYQAIKVSKVFAEKVTRSKSGKPLQKLLILETPRFGKVLVLDEIVQLTEADEKYYHEPFVHIPLLSHSNPQNILIIGGGDGGILRELIKHRVSSIDLVDIDGEVIKFTRKYLPDFAKNAWEDPRLKIHIEDGAKFVKQTKKKFDVIIIDSPDPVGPAKSLFQTSFYLDCKKVLSPGGILIRQTGSSILQPEEMPSNFRQMEELFPEAQAFLTALPTYVGGYFTFVAGSPEKGLFKKALPKIAARFKKLKIGTEWYTPEMHKASMILPRELKGSLKKTEYGQELVVDLYDCDYSIISSREKLHQFVRRMCEVIKMKPYGEPLIPDFGHGMSKTAGPSLVQLIESSSITAHYSPHWRMVCLNIFTCTYFDSQKALQFAKDFFVSGRTVAFLLKRGPRLFKEDLGIIKIQVP